MARCPGQDQRYWKPEDIFDVGCPYCGYRIEFWKDEPFRICRQCGREVRNPRIDLACAQWCASADECLGRSLDPDSIAAPVVERLMALLEQRLGERSGALDRARAVCAQIDTLLETETAEPRLAKPAAMLAGAALGPDRGGRSGRVPAGDDGALDGDSMLELLVRSGLENDEAAAIEQLVRSVLAGRVQDSAEWRLVSDAVQLVRSGSAGEEGDGEAAASLHTATAKRIAVER